MQRSPEAQAYHRWYKLKLWCHVPTGLRWQCLAKALFTCHDCGWQARSSETHKLHCDHIKAHRGNWELFADPNNLRCLCENCHMSAKQQEERLGYSPEVGIDGWPLDDLHPAYVGKRPSPRDGLGPMSHPSWFRPVFVPTTIVCGPPASGKTTYIKAHAGPNDLVFDLDAIAVQMFGVPARMLDSKRRMDALRARNDRLGKLMWANAKDIAPRAWLIVAEPLAKRRQWWVDTIKPEQIIVIAAPLTVCLERASQDSKQRPNFKQSITDWWREYTPRTGDIVIGGGG